MGTDVADLLVTTGVSAIVSVVVSILLPRYLQKRDQRRDEDQKKVYATLHKEMVSALEGKNRAMMGFTAYRVAEEMSEIRVRGDLLPKRHRELEEDIRRLIGLRNRLDREQSSLYNVIQKCVQGVLDTTTFTTDTKLTGRTNLGDILGHDFQPMGLLYSSLATGDKAVWGDELRKLVVGAARNLGGTIVPDKDPDEMFAEIEPSIRQSRAPYMAAAEDLFALTESINRGLEEALRTGKPYKRIV